MIKITDKFFNEKMTFIKARVEEDARIQKRVKAAEEKIKEMQQIENRTNEQHKALGKMIMELSISSENKRQSDIKMQKLLQEVIEKYDTNEVINYVGDVKITRRVKMIYVYDVKTPDGEIKG